MPLSYLTEKSIDLFINNALREDIGERDHSSWSSVPKELVSNARLLIKEDGILAGVSMAKKIFDIVDSSLDVDIKMEDGQKVVRGDIAFSLVGNARSILAAERLVLNCMQRMSGIATYTRKLQQMIAETQAKVLDTRKTTPNFRIAEKWAVSIGGGTNHRYGLFDMIMLKDNHIDYAGGIKNAVESAKKYIKENKLSIKIEVESRSLEEVREILNVGGVDIIMLDNMTTDMMKEAVKLIDKKAVTEASGGITEDNIKEVAQCGVDFISIGALTHSVKSVDMSLKAVKN